MKLKKLIRINKKGLGEISFGDALLFFLGIMIVATLALVFASTWTQKLRDIYVNADLEPLAYDARLIYSDQCFSYTDEAGRVYTGTIDPARFNEEILKKCIPLGGVVNYAVAAELKTTMNGKETVLFIKSDNWGMNTQEVKVSTYFVNIKGNNPGMLNIYHKEGR